MPADPTLEKVAALTAPTADEIDSRPADASIAWPWAPSVRSMVEHIGTVHRWVTGIVTSGGPVDESSIAGPGPGATALRDWYGEGRDALLRALDRVPPATSCWIIGGRSGTAAFWRRRMVFENVKHLIDLRAAGGAAWMPADELGPADYADGVDELFTEFLWRSRPSLAPLPGPVLLAPTDLGRRWRIDESWSVTRAERGDEVAVLHAPASWLALTVWERADPLAGPPFHLDGDAAAVSSFRRAPIHPW